jgi:diguanylate cyclase (GGDEF)-like protein/PAS domain S-box-containing protein
VTTLREGGAEEAALLELLYLCPTAIVKFDATGAIQLMNPLGVQLLMPMASGQDLSNFYEIFSKAAPEIREMVSRFEPSVGRICDEYRVIVDVAVPRGPRSVILSVTMQKVDRDVLIAIIMDVTATAVRERFVRANEARLHAVFDGIKDFGICTVDLNGAITSWNHSAERMEGFREDEVIGMPADLLLPARGSGREAIAPLLDAARQDGRHEYEAWRIRKDGSRYWANSIITVLHDKADSASIGYSIVTRDLTQRKRSEDHLRLLASTDPLTGVYNRRAFYDAAMQAETRWRDDQCVSSVLMLDLDHFKSVNDRFGHDAGDQALRHFVGIVHGELHEHDVIGRNSGQSFFALLKDTDGPSAIRVAERIRQRLAATPLEYEKETIVVSVSIGVAQIGVSGNGMASVIREATTALHAAKSNRSDAVIDAEQPTV